MNVVLIGSGGREHALAFAISKSASLTQLYILPGNPGTESLGTNVDINASDQENILQFCKNNKIDLVVVGPEQPLVEGLADLLRENGFPVFGPNKSAAEIEGDKSFSKNLMKNYNIPTADFEIFNSENYEKCVNYLNHSTYPTVIKASGLAAGKGVIIANDFSEAKKTIDDIFLNKLFGESGNTVVIEEFMQGLEASIFAVTDGDDYVILPSSQDHKRIFDGDKGKNTGGMGAYAPASLINEKLMSEIEDSIIKPTLEAMKSIGRKYNGCLYAGIMITKSGPKVVEFNCRFGDPETQVVLPLVDGDFLKLLYSAAIGKIDKNSVTTSGSCAICVIAASGGYPDAYSKGHKISGLDNLVDSDTIIYHAGTARKGNDIVTSGGRVLGITRIDKSGNLSDCKIKLYEEMDKIYFEGIHYRKDISDKSEQRV